MFRRACEAKGEDASCGHSFVGHVMIDSVHGDVLIPHTIQSTCTVQYLVSSLCAAVRRPIALFRSILLFVAQSSAPLTHALFRCAEDADAHPRDLYQSNYSRPSASVRPCDPVHRSDVAGPSTQLLRSSKDVLQTKPQEGSGRSERGRASSFGGNHPSSQRTPASTHPQPRASPARAPASHLHRAAGPLRRPRRHSRPVQSITVAHAHSGRAPLPPWRCTATESESIRFSW